MIDPLDPLTWTGQVGGTLSALEPGEGGGLRLVIHKRAAECTIDLRGFRAAYWRPAMLGLVGLRLVDARPGPGAVELEFSDGRVLTLFLAPG